MGNFDVHVFLTQCFTEEQFKIDRNIYVRPFEGLGSYDVLGLIDSYLVQVLKIPPQPPKTKESISGKEKSKGASTVVTIRMIEAINHIEAIKEAEEIITICRDVLALVKYQRGLISAFLSIQTDVSPPQFYTFVRSPYPVLQKSYNLLPTEKDISPIVFEKAKRFPLLRVYLTLFADAIAFSDNVVTNFELQTRLLKLWTLLETMAINEKPKYKREKVEALFSRYPAFVHPNYSGYFNGDVLETAYKWRNIIVHSGGCDSAANGKDRKFCDENQANFGKILNLLTWACRDLIILYADSLQ